MQQANKGTQTQHQSDDPLEFTSSGTITMVASSPIDALAAVACGLPSAPDESTRQRWGVSDAAGEQLWLDESGAA